MCFRDDILIEPIDGEFLEDGSQVCWVFESGNEPRLAKMSPFSSGVPIQMDSEIVERDMDGAWKVCQNMLQRSARM